jgi:hypothetical protein
MAKPGHGARPARLDSEDHRRGTGELFSSDRHTNIMTPHPKRLKYTAASVLLVAAVMFALVSAGFRDERRQVSTGVQWRSFHDWSLGWKRVAYCSEQAAAFRGWKAELGPL